MEYIKCILCDRDNTEPFLKENNYNAVKCKFCGLIYVNPRPSISEIKTIYESNDAITTNFYSFVKLKEKKILFAKKDLKIVRKYKNNGRILEIGSAAGYFLHTARSFGYEVYGLEINERFVKFSRDLMKLDVRSGTILDCPFPDNYFDIIYMRNVLSHLSNPLQELKKVNSMLKSKGLFIFETGNAAELNPYYIEKLVGLGLPEHLFHYSRENISQLLNKTNFHLIKKIEYSMHFWYKLYNLFGEKIRSKYKELKNNKVDENIRISYKQKFFARLDIALFSLGRILPKKNKWLSILYISQRA